MSGRSRNLELAAAQERLGRAHNSVSIAAGKTVIELERENPAVENEKSDESSVPRQRSHADAARDLITRQGFPAATTSPGTSLVTTEQAPITARAPIVIPGKTKA